MKNIDQKMKKKMIYKRTEIDKIKIVYIKMKI